MTDQKHLPTADALGPGGSADGCRPDSRERHEPPRIVRLGTVAELTLGEPNEIGTDTTFPGSVFA